MTLRIEMLVTSMPAAGLEMVIAYLVRGLARRGHDVGVTCIEERGYLGEKLAEEGHRITVVPAPGVKTNFYSPSLASWFRDSKPDVVHVHSGAWLKGVTGARQGRVPRIVFTLHGIYPVEPWYVPIFGRIASRRTDHGVAVSETLREYLIRRGMKRAHTSVIPNGVDCDRFRAQPDRGRALREELAIPADAFVVGTVSRLHPVKNQALLLEAFDRARRELPGSLLLLVGEGELRDELEQRAKQLGMNDSVRFLGFSADPSALYHVFDLFVLSSLIEGTSMSALEAMSSGVPVLATAVGGTPELLGNGAYGELVPTRDATALSEAIIDLAKAPARRSDLAHAARNRIETMYSFDRLVQSYEAVYMSRTCPPVADSSG